MTVMGYQGLNTVNLAIRFDIRLGRIAKNGEYKNAQDIKAFNQHGN
ncbi:hypothetical protein XBKB1_2670005 [Xenorhabdus bovienii str. kraussei Becker Underwood]|uniref:Uncharacterized protein n=1 Tax=Xenorhabdus bovienii str. kraussei Becker Underwood TaxID=1398204 RepID=A0A077PWT6_XENBV|nr:hypothetical protein XBKB1_2670005 [Xenorhabdus bovienii str. kraussei Becker Underwood]